MRAGLSILIPVFNRDVTALVGSLLRQAGDWRGEVEIRLLDDKSEEAYRLKNRPLGGLAGVCYEELPANVGRAAIRNQLAASAKHEWLLLLDNTTQLPDQEFIARYRAALGQAPVLAGGVSYAAQPPADPALRLRWLYGRQREARSLAQRQAAPYDQLLLNNLLLRSDLLQRFPLDERLRGYGHEDTKLGWQLAEEGVPVHHLANPVLHAGLETAAAFLQKSEQAVRNLAYLRRQSDLAAGSRLVQAAQRLRHFRVGARAALALCAPLLRRNLLGTKPSLKALDALKLYWMLREG